MLEIGKKYVSKAGNVIVIRSVEKTEDGEGRPLKLFIGHFERVIKGHENLMEGRNKFQKFFEDGRWTQFPDSSCIHNLVQELEE